jgi:dTDP-4-dehydrorhamnose 3,5-epimerase
MSDAHLVETTAIPGLLRVTCRCTATAAGWFKESYQRAKLEAAGLPRWRSSRTTCPTAPTSG